MHEKNLPGFTLIELLIAVSITTILFSLGAAQYMKFNRQQILDQTVSELKTNLTQARNMALAGRKTCTGGFDGILVTFNDEEQSYALYSSCDNQDPDKLVQIGEIHKLSQGVKIEGSPGDVLFKTVTGGTDLIVDQTITLSLSGINARIQVTPSGKIELLE